MIILNLDQYNAVKGDTSTISSLDPIAIGAELYFLPEEVLSDMNHSSKFNVLGLCEIRDFLPNEIMFLNTKGE